MVLGGGVVEPALGYLGTGREKFSKTRDSLLALRSCCFGLIEDEALGELGGLVAVEVRCSLSAPPFVRSSDEKPRK
jgi:hypothetical protein